MASEIHQTLENLGFSRNEAKMYLAALEAGTASAQTIAAKARLKRTTVYSLLDALIAKGFVVETKESGKTRYVAESPENLVQTFERYQQNLHKALPELKAIHNTKAVKPKVQFFEGRDGILKIYEDTIREKPNVILELNTSELFTALPENFPKEYVAERLKHHIRAQRLAPEDKHWTAHKANDAKEISETKLLPPEQFAIPVEINVYNDKVAVMSYSDEMGLIIESKGIAQAMRTVYTLLWKATQS